MKKIAILAMAVAAITFASCKKDSNNGNGTQSFTSLEADVITDFATKTAIPGYTSLKAKAILFDSAVVAFSRAKTDANLANAQQAWRDLRVVWEQSEGFLIGPVEDNQYDPHMDSWPVDSVQLRELVTNPDQPLDVNTVANLQDDNLHGFHPAEFVMWGKDGKKKAADITDREMIYLTSLTQDITNTCTNTYNAWIPTSGNFAHTVQSAGPGNTRWGSKQAFLLEFAHVIGDICNEVGDEKMKTPFDTRSVISVESPFSSNSLADFKNNIQGAYDTYMGRFGGNTGKSLHDLVYAKNIALDKKVQDAFNAAISTFSTFSLPFEQAIFNERPKIQTSMAAILVARDAMQTDVEAYITANVKD